MDESMFIGLDGHARSVAAALLDGTSGELRSAVAPARTAELVAWLAAQGGQLAVAYEAGPPPASGWHAPARRPAFPAWWPPPVASREPRRTASRPISPRRAASGEAAALG